MSDMVLWNSVIHALQGSCDSLDAVLETYEAEYLADDSAFLEYLDNEIFECVCCGWWFPISECAETVSGELACENCVEDNE